MKYKHKIICLIYIFIVGIIVFTCDTSKLITDLNYVRCGEATGIPKPVPQLTTIAYSILIIGVPLVLIAFGILTLVKALASSNVDEVVKARKKLGKKFVIAAAALLTASLVQFVINRVSNDGDGTSVAECISCFLYSTNCGASTTGNDVKTDTIYSNYSNGAIETTQKNSNSNSSSNSSNGSTTQPGSKTILVGDSRTVGICGYTDSTKTNTGNCRSVQAVARGGIGYNWLQNTAVAEVNKLLGSERTNIVILLGVNDVGESKSYAEAAANKYISIISSQINSNWKNHNVIFVSAGPIAVERIGGSWPVTQTNISYFNSLMKSKISSLGASNVKYCDIESKLKSGLQGKYWSDNIHYNNEGSTFYYNTVMSDCK